MSATENHAALDGLKLLEFFVLGYMSDMDVVFLSEWISEKTLAVWVFVVFSKTNPVKVCIVFTNISYRVLLNPFFLSRNNVNRDIGRSAYLQWRRWSLSPSTTAEHMVILFSCTFVISSLWQCLILITAVHISFSFFSVFSLISKLDVVHLYTAALVPAGVLQTWSW